jgi:DNA polymerase-3 subunit alpha
MELLARHGGGRHRVLGLPGVALEPPASSRAGCRTPRAHLDDLVAPSAPRTSTSEVQRNGIAEQEQVNEAIVELRARWGASSSRPPTCTTCGAEDYHHHCSAAVRADEVDARSAEAVVRHERVLPQELGGARAVVLRDARGGRDDARDRRALRCDVELDRQLIPSYPCPDGKGEAEYLRELVDLGLRLRYGDPVPAAARERAEMELSVIGSMASTPTS